MIRVNNVTLEYKINRNDKVMALNDISFNIHEGERVGLIGLNGAGKSSIIKLLTGIIKPTQGSISIFEKDPFLHRKEVCCSYGVMFGQRSQLWWDLPVRDSFYINGNIYGMKKKNIIDKLEQFSEWLKIDYLDVPVRKLSLGRRVMCDVLLAMLHEPSILFLDESTIALDVVNKKRILEMLSLLNDKSGTALFLTSHQLDDIETICDRIIVLNSGEVFFDGLLTEFMDTSKIKSVISIRASEIEKIRNKLAVCEEDIDIKIRNTANEICIYLSDENEKYDLLLKYLANNIALDDFEIRRINLEERILLMEG